uniref:Phospholipid-transporting ATPase n=1 Tax=Ciona savignyi TaxID=51511 RepID=H2YBJ8_CIOSA
MDIRNILSYFGPKETEKQRDIKANDSEYNGTFNYAVNKIKTSKYTWYNFLLINLWEQFHRVVNVYFVILVVLQFIPEISSLNPTTSIIPIIVVLGLTAMKDGFYDYVINNRSSSVVKDETLTEEKWMNIKVGDIIQLKNNENVTADLLLLSSSEEHNLVYIETAELDGETNLKVRQALPETGEMKDNLRTLRQFNGHVKCEAPNNYLHKFTGNLYWNNETFAIDNENILLRGCTLRNTEWCFGLVIFAGPDTKLMQNTGKSVLKRTSIERLMNKLVWLIFAFLLLLATVTAVGNTIWERYVGVHFQVYMPWASYAPNEYMSGFLMFWSYIIILNTVVPISLFVSIEFIRVGQSWFINFDRAMYYEKKDLPALARTTTLNEELGQIEYVFSDKTGTLTQNIMEFNKCVIGGTCYGEVYNEDGIAIVPDDVNKLQVPGNMHTTQSNQLCQIFFLTRLGNSSYEDMQCEDSPRSVLSSRDDLTPYFQPYLVNCVECKNHDEYRIWMRQSTACGRFKKLRSFQSYIYLGKQMSFLTSKYSSEGKCSVQPDAYCNGLVMTSQTRGLICTHSIIYTNITLICWSLSTLKMWSGYAFSHERGFGDLITTGRMSMRRNNSQRQSQNNHQSSPLPSVDLSYNEYAETSFQFHDKTLVDKIRAGDKHCDEFFRLLSICHSVMIENSKNGNLLYRAQSPDEAALVSAARNFGFVFKSKSYDTLTIMEMGKPVEYKVLAMLDFDNVRKRMSVIIRNNEGKVVLYCKGADSAILQNLSKKCDPKLISKTEKHLDSFARAGLRTLCLAKKELEEDVFSVWKEAHFKASTALEDREDRLSAVYEEIERDMELLGATAIEDKLQDGVPETIANLSNANIKIWVLTGDKQETAINIGYSCHMLTEEMKNVLIIKGYTEDEVIKSDRLNECVINQFSLQELQNSVTEVEIPNVDRNATSTHGLVINGHSLVILSILSFQKNAKIRLLTPTPDNSFHSYSDVVPTNELCTYTANFLQPLNGNFHPVILTVFVHALNQDMKLKFLELASQCTAVICCRVTPIQKAKVVELVKKNKKAVTLAIGDGANDVSMIKAAHIGVGISGEEGTQAVLSADFAFGQFRYLERLLLVHGRWSYMRICKFLNYFFYKNFAFTLVHFWFAFFNGYSAQSVYDDWFVTLYNIIYTSLPVIFLAVLDQDVNDQVCIKLPKLYLSGQKNELFNLNKFSRSIIKGILTSLVMFFIPYGALYENVDSVGLDMADHQFVATVIATAMIFVVNLQIAIDTDYWTGLNHFFTWGSILALFPFQFALYSDGLYNLITSQFPFVGVARTSYTSPTLWFLVLLLTVTCIMPVVFLRVLYSALWPSYLDKV